jgi:hypothetical protein
MRAPLVQVPSVVGFAPSGAGRTHTSCRILPACPPNLQRDSRLEVPVPSGFALISAVTRGSSATSKRAVGERL